MDISPGKESQIGIYLDTETSGLSDSDYLLQLSMIKFKFNTNNYHIKELGQFNQFIDFPATLSSEEIENLKGRAFKYNKVTYEMIQGKEINKEELIEFLQGVKYVVCHNVGFDHKFVMRYFRKEFTGKIWLCSCRGIPWLQEGFQQRGLQALCTSLGFVYNAHDALEDCKAGLFLLKQILPKSKQIALRPLLTIRHQLRVYARFHYSERLKDFFKTAKKCQFVPQHQFYPTISKCWCFTIELDGRFENNYTGYVLDLKTQLKKFYCDQNFSIQIFLEISTANSFVTEEILIDLQEQYRDRLQQCRDFLLDNDFQEQLVTVRPDVQVSFYEIRSISEQEIQEASNIEVQETSQVGFQSGLEFSKSLKSLDKSMPELPIKSQTVSSVKPPRIKKQLIYAGQSFDPDSPSFGFNGQAGSQTPEDTQSTSGFPSLSQVEN